MHTSYLVNDNYLTHRPVIVVVFLLLKQLDGYTKKSGSVHVASTKFSVELHMISTEHGQKRFCVKSTILVNSGYNN